MPVDFEIPDSGFANVKIGGATGTVDVYSVNNQLVAMNEKVREELAAESDAARTYEYLNRVCALLESLGFGRVSHFAADKFDDAIFKAVADLGKDPA